MDKAVLKDTWYWEVIVDCGSTIVELFTSFLFDRDATGIEELSDDASVVRLKVFFNSGTPDPQQIITSIVGEMTKEGHRVELKSVEKKNIEDWQANWKSHFKPIEIGNMFIVTPPWENVTSLKKQIVIQPGFGFGTGYHESTNLALQLLEWVCGYTSFSTVLDVGTGSGILSIGALLLGADQVNAIDIDDDAVKEVTTNLQLSGLDPDRCNVAVSDPAAYNGDPADLVMANIEDHILINLADDLVRLTRKKGLNVCPFQFFASNGAQRQRQIMCISVRERTL